MAPRPTASVRLLPALLLGLASACSSPSKSQNCTVDTDCPSGSECTRGICTPIDDSCSSVNPCSGGRSCCGGVCSETSCCAFDSECPDGWCDGGRCQAGQRPNCSSSSPCASGRCLNITNRCVECLTSDDCGDSSKVCTLNHACESPGNCVSENSCSLNGLICDPDTGNCRPCISRVECGDLACIDGRCDDCTSSDECGPNRTCSSGRCINSPGAPCATTSDCSDGLICQPDDTCGACLLPNECPNGTECVEGVCFAVDGDCSTDSDCNPPTTICNAGNCSTGCGTLGCPEGQSCDANTGRCLPFGEGSLPLGSSCDEHSDCNTNVCWPVVVSAGVIQNVCSQPCVQTADCPTNFVCVTLGDGDVCLDKSMIEPTAPFNLQPGASCTGSFTSETCKSGFCNTTRSECMETCGKDEHCSWVDDSFVCVNRWPVGTDVNNDGFLSPEELAGFTALCHPPVFQGRPNGAVCQDDGETGIDHTKCASGYCVQTPDFFTKAVCADGCCSPADCPGSAPICKPIDVWDGVRDNNSEPYGFQKVCLWREYEGTKAAGEECTSNDECSSEICAKGRSGVSRCSHTCCTPADCAGYDWAESCRTPFFDVPGTGVDDNLADPYFDQLRLALGREFITLDVRDQASGLSTLCVPK